MIKTINLKKTYTTDEVETTALNEVNLEIGEGEFVAIMGPSGCGKSTLLNVMGLLDNPSDGEYHFLGKEVSQYHKDVRTGKIFSWFSLIAIFISCTGLYGLTLFITEQRTKEIGVRKVLGGSILGIVALLSRDFMELVGIGFLIAVPVAWYTMHRWLQNFAYHIHIRVFTFLLAGALAMIIALATVSWQSVKAAIANPVESLRNE